MSVTIAPPTDRVCEECGREEEWDEDVGAWRVSGDAGRVYCIHEWDINGSYVPFAE